MRQISCGLLRRPGLDRFLDLSSKYAWSGKLNEVSQSESWLESGATPDSNAFQPALSVLLALPHAAAPSSGRE